MQELIHREEAARGGATAGMQPCQQPERSMAQADVGKQSRDGDGRGMSGFGTGSERPEHGRRENLIDQGARHAQAKRGSKDDKHETSRVKQYAKVEPVRTGKHGEVGNYEVACDEDDCREQTGRPRNLSGEGDTAEGWQGAKAKSRKRSPS